MRWLHRFTKQAALEDFDAMEAELDDLQGRMELIQVRLGRLHDTIALAMRTMDALECHRQGLRERIRERQLVPEATHREPMIFTRENRQRQQVPS